jgi:hypothetical protein
VKRFVNFLKRTIAWDARTWRRGVSLIIVAAVLGLLMTIWGVESRLQGHVRNPAVAVLGGCLVILVLVRAVYAIFGQVPDLSAGSRTARAEKLKYRWRIAWAVGTLMVATIAVTAVTFAISDHIRASTPFCNSTDAEPAASAASDQAASSTTTPEAPATTDTTAPSTDTTPPSGAPEEQSVEKEAFGVERGIRSHTFSVKAPSADEALALNKDDFKVYADDGHTETGFAEVVAINPLTNGDAQILLRIDMSCHSALEGAHHTVITVYQGETQLDQTRWDLEVSLQSRLVFFALALAPVIIVLAMYQTFAMWPTSLKRWFTSVVAVGISVLSVFTAAGLRNPTWSPELLGIGTLIGTAYGAGITTANLVKNGGHDLDDKTKP